MDWIIPMVYGWIKTSLIDYPDNIAPVLFTAGCTLTCPYCHNHKLITETDIDRIPNDQIIEYLTKHLRKYDGVVITGGEPTLYPGLKPLIMAIKALGLKVKLDTNGTNFSIVQALNELHLLDYVALDIKGGPYIDIPSIKDLTEYLKCGTLDYEFRSTVYPDYFTKDLLPKVLDLVKGAKLYVLQQYVPVTGKCELPQFTESELMQLKLYFTPHVTKCTTRGIKKWKI